MTIHAATLSTIRQQIARIPAGPGRSADEYVEDLRRTIDCMEVAETLETPTEPLRLREGGFYRRRDGRVHGPLHRHGNDQWPFHIDDMFYRGAGISSEYPMENRESQYDLIAEVPAPAEVIFSEDANAFHVDTILTPTVPVTVDRNTKWCDERGYLSAIAVALFTGLNAQIAELRKMIEREVG